MAILGLIGIAIVGPMGLYHLLGEFRRAKGVIQKLTYAASFAFLAWFSAGSLIVIVLGITGDL